MARPGSPQTLKRPSPALQRVINVNQKVPNLNLSSRISCPPGVPCTTTVRIVILTTVTTVSTTPRLGFEHLSVIKQDLSVA